MNPLWCSTRDHSGVKCESLFDRMLPPPLGVVPALYLFQDPSLAGIGAGGLGRFVFRAVVVTAAIIINVIITIAIGSGQQAAFEFRIGGLSSIPFDFGPNFDMGVPVSMAVKKELVEPIQVVVLCGMENELRCKGHCAVPLNQVVQCRQELVGWCPGKGAVENGQGEGL